ncbi:tetratricopeptide repeat protein [Flavobacteriaceae bacterium]|jgi:tetratricopeptide (TPR) repeat protein|nr:tetratricopeptide repeat protein [Flavobacteriaceae bacterium]|tara:strand:+ start:3831 stop:4586 length:756 start_codon:yes stop_codon:yes gene_type:complete
MATYKKKASKSKSKGFDSSKNDSTTAEVFETLDVNASKTELIVSKYQNYIIGFVGLTVFAVLGYLGYENLIFQPKSDEANNELFTAQNYFNKALSDTENSDSLFLLSLNGGEGKYGFLDIIKNYSGTDAANISVYSAGMAYFNLNDFQNSIEYLKNFNSDDEILKALAVGVIGDSFAELNQLDDALDAYRRAANSSSNKFSSPKFLLKAGNTATLLGKKSEALKYYNRIKNDYPKSSQSNLIDIQIGKNIL